MIRTTKRSRVFEEHQIPTEGDDLLFAKLMFPKAPVTPKRVVLIPPLIGAGAAQSLIIFRNFAKRGAIIISFEYRAHLRSTGTFELDKTLVDTTYATRWASEFANERGLPLHGFTTCYGLVSLLASQFKKHQFDEWQSSDASSSKADRCSPFYSLNAVSGLFRLDRIIRFENFAPILARNLGIELDREKFLQGIEQDHFDWEGDAFRDALTEFLTGLFPGINISRDSFAELSYDRVNIPNTLSQLLRARYLEDIYVPREIPCNFFFGRNDDIMSLDTPEGRVSYCEHAKALIPHATLYEREIDHGGLGPDHDPVIDHLSDLFEEAESRARSFNAMSQNSSDN